MAIAVVFDCDGVLVDSEELAWDAWRQVLGRYGLEVTASDVELLTGRTEEDAYGHFGRRGDLPPHDDFWRELAEAISARFEAHLRAFEDARSTLSRLQEEGVPVAVASSSPRERLDLALERTGLAQYVNASVAGDEVDNGKPEPDLFLEAARRLGVDPSDCVAVEDTAVGLRAAKTAGMRAIAVDRDRSSPQDFAEAAAVLDRLSADALLEPR